MVRQDVVEVRILDELQFWRNKNPVKALSSARECIQVGCGWFVCMQIKLVGQCPEGSFLALPFAVEISDHEQWSPYVFDHLDYLLGL